MHANKIAKLQGNLSSTPENYLGSSGGQVHHAATWTILQMAKLGVSANIQHLPFYK